MIARERSDASALTERTTMATVKPIATILTVVSMVAVVARGGSRPGECVSIRKTMIRMDRLIAMTQIVRKIRAQPGDVVAPKRVRSVLMGRIMITTIRQTVRIPIVRRILEPLRHVRRRVDTGVGRSRHSCLFK
jgi:hypothetical protein